MSVPDGRWPRLPRGIVMPVGCKVCLCVSGAGMIDMWNGANTTDFFQPPCNVVSGSAGEMWPPGQEKDEVSLYSPDMCMYVCASVRVYV